MVYLLIGCAVGLLGYGGYYLVKYLLKKRKEKKSNNDVVNSSIDD